jgi:hypothetical protein
MAQTADKVSLPKPALVGATSVEQVLAQRRSRRK